MSNERFTKGPWLADVRSGCLAVYPGERRNCLCEEEDGDVMYQTGKGERSAAGYRVVTDEQVANAHLIAAAPELYEAIDKATRRNGGPVSAEDTVDHVEYVLVREDDFNAMCAALIKACGEKP